MAKRKTLPKDFEQLVQTASDEDVKKVFGKCDINAYGRSSMENCGIFLCRVRDMQAQFRARSSEYLENLPMRYWITAAATGIQISRAWQMLCIDTYGSGRG